MNTLECIPTVRAFRRPSQVHAHDNVPCCEIADATGVSQIEQQLIKLLDARTSHAMKVSLEDALKSVCARFALRGSVVAVVGHHDHAEFKVVLAVRSSRS
jgi:hypothetical protein